MFFFFGTGKSLEFSLVKKFFYQISAFTAILFDIGLPSLEFLTIKSACVSVSTVVSHHNDNMTTMRCYKNYNCLNQWISNDDSLSAKIWRCPHSYEITAV